MALRSSSVSVAIGRQSSYPNRSIIHSHSRRFLCDSVRFRCIPRLATSLTPFRGAAQNLGDGYVCTCLVRTATLDIPHVDCPAWNPGRSGRRGDVYSSRRTVSMIIRSVQASAHRHTTCIWVLSSGVIKCTWTIQLIIVPRT